MPPSRRAFLAGGLAGSLLALPPLDRPATALPAAEGGLLRRPIPSSGETLPALGIGTSRRYEVAPTPEAIAPLREAVKRFVGLGQKPEPWYLKAGDVVELGIEKLGQQRQDFVAWTGTAA